MSKKRDTRERCLRLGLTSVQGGRSPFKLLEVGPSFTSGAKWSPQQVIEDPLDNWLRQQAQSLLGWRELPSKEVARTLDAHGLLRSRLPLRGDASCGESPKGGWFRSFVRRVGGMIRPAEELT